MQIFGKAGVSIMLIIAGVIGGQFLQSRVFSPKADKIDYDQVRKIFNEEISRYPKPEVKLQTFECDKIKGLREFTYSPNYTGNIAVNGVDSSAVHRWIERSVMNAIQKHVRSVILEPEIGEQDLWQYARLTTQISFMDSTLIPCRSYEASWPFPSIEWKQSATVFPNKLVPDSSYAIYIRPL